MTRTIIIAGFLAFTAGLTNLQAQTVNISTTAVPFLRISPDARAAGMADMGIATSPDDANSSFHNLAKTPFAAERSAIAANYTPWMHEVVDGVYLATLSGYHQLDEQQAVGASLRYFNLGDYRVTDYSGNKLQTAHPREFSFDAGYARKLSGTLSLGLAFRYIRSDLASGAVNGNTYKAGNAVAADISLYYHGLNTAGQGWSGGLVLSNLGTKIGYTDDANSKEFLPATIGLGIAYTAVVDEINRLTFGAELSHLLVPAAPVDSTGLADYHTRNVMSSWGHSFSNGEYPFSLGIEYGYDQIFFARVGYHVGDKSKGDQSFFTAGLGLDFYHTRLDLSYLVGSGNGITRNPLSNTVRLGLAFTLGKGQTK
jgi:hypothetical protein